MRFSTVADGVHAIGEAEADRGLHRVGAIAAALLDHVADVVDHVGVVAQSAEHTVGADAAVQRVVAGEAKKNVGALISIESVIAAAAACILDPGIVGDRDVGGHHVGVGKGPRRQIDCAGIGPPGKIERVDATGIIEAQDRM